MRVSTANVYNNFETGEKITMEKLKPVQNMRNNCVIQLFDSATGKLKEECSAENVISDYFTKMAAKRFGLYNVFTYYATQSTYSDITLFGQLVLSDYSGVEDPGLKCFKGNVIGWADKYQSYAGTDTKRGSVNVSETTIVGSKKVKFVFDFGTGVANGTFNTLFWMPSDHCPSATAQVQPCVAQTWKFDSGALANTPGSGYYGAMAIKGDKLYHTLNGIIYSTQMSYNPSRLVRNSSTTQVEADLSSVDTNIRGIQWDTVNLVWWVFGDTNDKMYKLDENFNVLDSYSINATTYFNTNRQWVVFQGSLYAIKYISATVYNLYQISLTDMSLVKTTNLYVEGGNYAAYATKSDVMLLYNDENNLIVMAASTGTGVRTNSAAILEVATDGTILGDYGMYWGETLPVVLAYNYDYNTFESYTTVFNLLKRPMSQLIYLI